MAVTYTCDFCGNPAQNVAQSMMDDPEYRIWKKKFSDKKGVKYVLRLQLEKITSIIQVDKISHDSQRADFCVECLIKHLSDSREVVPE